MEHSDYCRTSCTMPRSCAVIRLYLKSVQSSPVNVLNRVNIASSNEPYGSLELVGAFGASCINITILPVDSSIPTNAALSNIIKVIDNSNTREEIKLLM